jgi:hypothetical protein
MKRSKSAKKTARAFLDAHPFLDCEALGNRWLCHPRTAARRMRRLGCRAMKLAPHQLLFRLSDVEKIEAEAFAAF